MDELYKGKINGYIPRKLVISAALEETWGAEGLGKAGLGLAGAGKVPGHSDFRFSMLREREMSEHIGE